MNSRGGKSDGYILFNIFYKKCETILCSDSGVQEQKKTDNDNILYGSTIISIPDLRKTLLKH